MIKQVTEWIKKEALICEGDTVIVGVSGGADSVCLLRILLELQQTLQFSLGAVHVEHGIRGEREGIRGGCRSMEETQYQAAHLLLDGRRIGVPEELRDQIPEEIRHFHRADRTGNPF